jgi:hypothetical protein
VLTVSYNSPVMLTVSYNPPVVLTVSYNPHALLTVSYQLQPVQQDTPRRRMSRAVRSGERGGQRSSQVSKVTYR